MPQNAAPPVTTEDLLSALAGARRVASLWDPRTDALEWLGDAPLVLGSNALIGVRSGTHLGRVLQGEAVGRRGEWLAQPRRAHVGTYRLGPVEGGTWIEERLTLLKDGRVLGLLENVTGARRERERLAHLALFDELTGHLSRAHLRTVLARRVSQGEPVCFGLIGIDRMMGLNQAFGYDVADTVLAAVGARLAARLGPDDALGRMGSAKFGVVFSNLAPEGLLRRLEALQAAVRDATVQTEAGPVAVTVSAAGVVLPAQAATTHDAFAAAEDALTRAKEFGLDQITLYEPDPGAGERHVANMAVADDLVSAMREDRLRLAFQPIVRADDPAKAVFHECLLRLIEKDGTVVNAGRFMPVAERLGLVRMIDARVMDMAFEVLAAHPKQRLSVNLSPQTLSDPGWLARFDAMRERHGDACERLIVEVTEATAVEDGERLAALLNALRDRGCAVALDDFGAGYTSFQQLRSLRLDIVKIDGSYVRSILGSADDQVFVRALASLARHHELMVVAEMVDSDEAGALLEGLGVDCFQGFHFGMPEIEPPWVESDERAA